jgi:hypothetical protein
MFSERLAGKIQRLVDEYLGAVGSAAIVARSGEILFQSTHDDSACGLVATLREVPSAWKLDEPTVVNLPVAKDWCSYAVALDERHVLFVISVPAVAPGVLATRMKKAAKLLHRVLATDGGTNAAPSGTGGSGAPAFVIARRNAPRSN